MVSPTDDRYRVAALAYFLYGTVYLIGGGYLIFHGVGVRGSRASAGAAWLIAGGVLVLGIPFLLRHRRAWFERWVLSRRDFARILAAFMAVRALNVLRVAIRPETAELPAPWGGTLTFRAGAVIFFAVTMAALVLIARAAWTPEPGETGMSRSGR